MTPTARVGDIADQIRGVTYAKEEASDTPRDQHLPLLRAGNIGDSGLIFDDILYVPSSRVSERQHLRPNDVLIAASSGSLSVVGKAARVTGSDVGSFGAFCKVLRPNGDVHPGYFAHYFRTPAYRRYISSVAAGANINNLRSEDLDRIEIPLPSLTEQRRIAAILDEADALRTLHRGSLKNLERLRVAHFETSFANARFAPTVIADVVAEVPNAIRTGPFGSDLLHSEFVDDGVPVLGIDNVVSNEFVWAKPRFITQEKYESLKRYTVRGGDVLITIMGTVGRCGVVPDDIDRAINTKHLCCITLDQSRCLPDYLHDYFLYHPTAREYLRKTSKGAVMDGLNTGIIKQMPIVLPSIDAQRHYVGQITEVSTLANSAQSRDVDALFVSLQHRAFRGEL